jgi:hypothetical protein
MPINSPALSFVEPIKLFFRPLEGAGSRSASGENLASIETAVRHLSAVNRAVYSFAINLMVGAVLFALLLLPVIAVEWLEQSIEHNTGVLFLSFFRWAVLAIDAFLLLTFVLRLLFATTRQLWNDTHILSSSRMIQQSERTRAPNPADRADGNRKKRGSRRSST